MARKRRIEFPGALYHVLARGNNKQEVFKDNQDFKIYLDRIEKYQKRYKFLLYAFVLMPNHAHLLLETCRVPLSKIMQGIQQSYTIYFHKKYNTVGHLFQGRYKAILCQRETYLLELIRYIHLNPVRKGLVEMPENYPWSSHHCYLGKLYQFFVARNDIFELFSEDETAAKANYLQFIRNGLKGDNQKKLCVGGDQRFLGEPNFIEDIKKKTEASKEVSPRKEKEVLLIRNKSLIDILKIVAEITKVSPVSILSDSKERYVSNARSLFAFLAVRYAGHKIKRIGKFLKKDPCSVSLMIRRVEEKRENDIVFLKNLNKIIKVINV